VPVGELPDGSSDSTRPWGSAAVEMGRPKTFIEMRREMNEDNDELGQSRA